MHGITTEKAHEEGHPLEEVLGTFAQAVEKATYPAVIGLPASRREAAKLTRAAMDALRPLGKKSARLAEIAAYLLEREY